MLNLVQILKFRTLCEWLEHCGNRGSYAGYTGDPDGLWYVTRPEFKPQRDGIIFYSTGHGWRLRKSPNWAETFEQRFPLWRAYQAGIAWVKWCVESGADCDIGAEYADTTDAALAWMDEQAIKHEQALIDAFVHGAVCRLS